ncbi:thiamine pyrophosphate-dependent enzyme [Millisia brevis]|uniref:thiamine pyrophosphate-dependent enzyme n=1 Tax=Millisia brevis TaxID=264148 RepID=UPI00082E0C03|nr:thiamine pyrophosphate-dependent enzyme [Millisia brevis]
MAEPIDDYFISAVRQVQRPPTSESGSGPSGPDASIVAGSDLTVAEALNVFDAQLGSRHLDLAARALRGDGIGYYTIGSSGHESNAWVAAALRPTDPALLHYRSGGFFLARAAQVASDRDAERDVLLGVVAATEEPISGGRHKVFGRHDLAVVPQTSTIASHLPRAVGVAFSIVRAGKLGVDGPWPTDAIAVCSFGDASANHSTAVGAINTALHSAYQGMPMPILFVCEDNGIGISTRTPDGWIAAAYGARPGLHYVTADGTDPVAVHEAATAAAQWARTRRAPAFLHLRTVRLMGHAGSDVESAYRTPREIGADYDRDPVLATARLLIESGVCDADEIVDRYEACRSRVLGLAKEVAELPQLDSADAVLAPLTAALDDAIAASADAHPADNPPGDSSPAEPSTLAQTINRTLGTILADHPGAILFGEDVARKGGVYGVTRGLQKANGRAKVFDTLLDEQAILGLALGAGVSGLLPIPEIQYLAYVHNALDQIRGEGATLQFFSDRRYRNPAIVRIAGYAYQKGFGGHFHNDNSVAALMDIPGVIIASPAHPDDAAAMLTACADAAARTGAFCIQLEPIALYHTRDLHREGDGGWLSGAAEGAVDGTIGTARTHGSGEDLVLVTFANGVPMSLRAAERLRAEHGIDARVVDLRWLAPLPIDDVLREANAVGKVLVVDETRHSGGVGQAVITGLVEADFEGRMARISARDSFIPLGDAALEVLISEDDVIAAARRMVPGR